MKAVLKAFALLVVLVLVVGAIGFWYFLSRGVSAQEQPGALEEFAARRVRNMAISRQAKSLTNPITSSDDVIAEGRTHFADHCAICHANDGSGDTAIGRGMWPKAPDMRLAQTQSLSDGELFWIIENGVRFTGMPAWSTGTKEGETASWHLVHFVRRLPKLTPEEIKAMEELNPKPPAKHEHAPAKHEHTHKD
jgi:mono/diheme cytochrome c family protein